MTHERTAHAQSLVVTLLSVYNCSLNILCLQLLFETSSVYKYCSFEHRVFTIVL